MSGAMNLPYLRPAAPVSTTVCVASVREACVELVYPELRDEFRLLVKGLGFFWEDRMWRKDINILTGPATDRAAETAVTLVEAGFIVDLRDAAAHAMAVDGTYAMEVTRWVTGGPKEHPDHCRIRWRRDEDFYKLARSLPGSRYVNGCVLVPYTSIEAVADFAEAHGFAMTDMVKSRLAQHEASLRESVILTPKKKVAQPAREAPSFRVKLEAPVDAGVDASLRDD